jgi:hypothetical protein
MPELRIIDQAVWEAVKARQDAIGFEMARDASGNACKMQDPANLLSDPELAPESMMAPLDDHRHQGSPARARQRRRALR